MAETAYRLPVIDTIKSSWRMVSGSKATFMYALGYIFLITLAISMVGGIVKIILPHSDVFFNITLQIILIPLQVGIYYIGLQRAYHRPIAADQVFYCFQSKILVYIFVAYILQLALFAIPTGFALLAKTVPFLSIIFYLASFILTIVAMVIAVRISLFYFFILDQNKNPWDAFKQSYFVTRGNFWRVFGVYFIGTLIVAISALPLGIGLIWTIPLMNIIYGMLYKQLIENNSAIIPA